MDIDCLALKKKAFNLILDAETEHLPKSTDLSAELRAEVAAL